MSAQSEARTSVRNRIEHDTHCARCGAKFLSPAKLPTQWCEDCVDAPDTYVTKGA